MVAAGSKCDGQRRIVTVFCSSTTRRGTPQWEAALRLGKLAARNGFSVVTGGYCGSMEAVSEGARLEIASRGQHTGATPEVIGVTATAVFPHRDPRGNKYLTRQIDADSILGRIDYLISMSRYFIALPGALGSLQEILCVWMSALCQKRGLPKPVIILFRDPWERCLSEVCSTLHVDINAFHLLRFVNSVEEAVQILLEENKSHL